jgi:leader peptidase (prepilin peptidase)/N-methyltransferase
MNRTESTPAVMGLQTRAATVTGAVAVAVAIAAFVHFGIDARGLIAAVFGAVLVVLAGFDLAQRRIPNRIVLPAIGGILAAQLVFFPGEALEWILAGVLSGLVLFLPAVLRAGAVGMGDVKLAALLGVGLGEDVVTALLFGSLAVGAAAAWILLTRGAAARHDTIPLGPFLAIGGIVALLAGHLPGA